MTVSHLRFGKNQVVAPYLINKANFIACHNFAFLDSYDMPARLHEGGTFLLTTTYSKDGRWPTATTQWEKRNIAVQVAQWDPAACIQCGRCSLICPHACIRLKVVSPEALTAAGADATFKTADAMGKEFKDQKFTIQISRFLAVSCG